ncbi:MAG: hypothetical protein IJR46_09140 [Neisseriaceae bacterium]|nr:hypothetical protein [Neisseriaceae bacterium]
MPIIFHPKNKITPQYANNNGCTAAAKVIKQLKQERNILEYALPQWTQHYPNHSQ